MLREWAFQILKALTYLNQNGITHYNLAPRNILLDAEVKGFFAFKLSLSSLPESFFFPLSRVRSHWRIMVCFI